MNFIKYCELPENEAWITQMMWKMKLDTGFDEQALIDAVYEQAELEDVLLEDQDDLGENAYEFFASWYDELGYPEDGAYPKSGAI